MTALAVHIIAGSLGIIFGFVALYAAKGAKLHRKTGMLFVYTLESPKGKLNGIPFVPFFIFGSIALLSSAGDLRLIGAGGARAIRGAPRLVRHLWRMCTALLIAAFSFFLGQAQAIPKPIRIPALLAIPPLAVFVAMLYCLWRVRIRRNLRGIAGASVAEAVKAR